MAERGPSRVAVTFTVGSAARVVSCAVAPHGRNSNALATTDAVARCELGIMIDKLDTHDRERVDERCGRRLSR